MNGILYNFNKINYSSFYLLGIENTVKRKQITQIIHGVNEYIVKNSIRPNFYLNEIFYIDVVINIKRILIPCTNIFNDGVRNDVKVLKRKQKINKILNRNVLVVIII